MAHELRNSKFKLLQRIEYADGSRELLISAPQKLEGKSTLPRKVVYHHVYRVRKDGSTGDSSIEWLEGTRWVKARLDNMELVDNIKQVQKWLSERVGPATSKWGGNSFITDLEKSIYDALDEKNGK